MKNKTILVLITALLLSAFASIAQAGPGPQYWQTLRSQAEFRELKKGDKIVYVCNQCKTVSEATVESSEKAMELCKEGAKVSCPSCKMGTKVVTKQKDSDSSAHTEVTYVNDKGEECMFIAKAADKK